MEKSAWAFFLTEIINIVYITEVLSVLHFVLHIEKNVLYFNIFYDTEVLHKNRKNPVKTVH